MALSHLPLPIILTFLSSLLPALVHSSPHPVIPRDTPSTANTLNGTYSALYLPSFHQDLFLGMPFASAVRFGAPQPITTSFSSPRPATTYGPTCPGHGSDLTQGFNISEDCLSINVVRPSTANASSSLPVLFWIYGGGFTQGATADPEFNLTYIVQQSVDMGQPIIAASVNYRKMGFGFLGSKELAAEGSLNVGLLDQRLGLHWIQENIAAFGGDPRKVTIWGESAGAMSISRQLLAYRGQDQKLFRAAIMVSGSPTTSPASPLSVKQPQFDQLANLTGCGSAQNSLACMRGVPFAQMNASIFAVNGTWFPYVDGSLISKQGEDSLAAGEYVKVPILHGTNADEGISFGFVGPSANTTAQLVEAGMAAWPTLTKTQIEHFWALYPYGGSLPPYSVPGSVDVRTLLGQLAAELGYGTQVRRAFGVGGDIVMIGSRRLMSQAWLNTSTPTYVFVFDTDPTKRHLFPGLGVGWAMHGSELSFEFVLPNHTHTGGYPWVANVPALEKVSVAMARCWVSFANSMDPNHHGLSYLPNWPVYEMGQQAFFFNGTIYNTNDFHVEPDTFREAGIAYINAHVKGFAGA